MQGQGCSDDPWLWQPWLCPAPQLRACCSPSVRQVMVQQHQPASPQPSRPGFSPSAVAIATTAGWDGQRRAACGDQGRSTGIPSRGDELRHGALPWQSRGIRLHSVDSLVAEVHTRFHSRPELLKGPLVWHPAWCKWRLETVSGSALNKI